jgi:hypothetical protein
MSSPLRVEMLEKQAQHQRDVLESHVVELRQNVRERLDVQRNVRKHVWPLAGIMMAAGLGLGYSLTGIFTRD